MIQVEDELKTINSECATLEKVIFTFNAQIFEKLKSPLKTTSNELRCKMVKRGRVTKRKTVGCTEKEGKGTQR